MNVDYLRLSVTDRCNLNCVYCTPLEKSQFLSRGEVLSYEEMAKVVELFVREGVKKLRITGGEPLIKKNLVSLVKMLKAVKGLEEITLTTNGIRLADFAAPLKDAGLDRVNVSLDTLNRERFMRITGVDGFDRVWEGITACFKSGLHPLKVNVILMRGINDTEIPDFIRLAADFPIIVRFIELFPANSRSRKLADLLITTDELRKTIEQTFGRLRPVAGIPGGGPAEYFRLSGSRGTVGFISGSSRDFCSRCNRIRLDCAGRIFPCLFSRRFCQIRQLLQARAGEEAMLIFVRGALRSKAEYHKKEIPACEVEMSTLGG